MCQLKITIIGLINYKAMAPKEHHFNIAIFNLKTNVTNIALIMSR